MINLQNQSAKFFRTFLADYILLIYVLIQFILVNKPPLCDPSIKRYDRLKILLKFWLSPGLCSNWPSWYMAQKFFGQKLSHMKVKWTHKKNLGFAFSFWRNGDFRKKGGEDIGGSIVAKMSKSGGLNPRRWNLGGSWGVPRVWKVISKQSWFDELFALWLVKKLIFY